MLVSCCKILSTLKLFQKEKKFSALLDSEDFRLAILIKIKKIQFIRRLTESSSLWNSRYENSAMPEDQIAQLVTETLAAVGLKVCTMMEIFMITMPIFVTLINVSGFPTVCHCK